MSYKITKATTADYPVIMKIWASAVLATHHFLKEEDFNYFKEAIPTQFLPQLEAYLCLDTRLNEPVGFMSLHEESLEMLFIDDSQRGKGAGKFLLNFAVQEKGTTRVDVNEQNPQAVGFYLKMGFEITGRSEKDGSGKDYPILHLKLTDAK